jgi:hypothetical protein
MAEQSGPTMSPLEASFAAHVRAFHQSLPPEEQSMLEQVLALAEAASGAEVTGFIGMSVGAGMSKGFYEWTKASFDQTRYRKTT